MLNLLISLLCLLPGQSTNDEVVAILKQKMEASTLCWNKGDLECFMDTYWKSDSLMFIGGQRITYGWENTLESYKVGYPTAKERGKLRFTYKAITRLSDEVYFMVGQYHLEREAGNDTGHFSLVWKWIDNDWVIIADHSSH